MPALVLGYGLVEFHRCADSDRVASDMIAISGVCWKDN